MPSLLIPDEAETGRDRPRGRTCFLARVLIMPKSLSLSTRSWRLGALCFAMLLPSLGISVANVALPSLSAAFGVSSQETQWVVIAYLVVVTASLVTAGRLGDLFGRKRMLLTGIVVFSAASLLASLAPAIWVVIAARAIQGVGGAMMMALTVAAVGDAVPEGRAGSAMGLLGTVSAIGTAAGPSLGGLLIAGFGWRSVFVLMTVVGLLAAVLVATQLRGDAGSEGKRPGFDFAGASLLMLSIGAAALAVTLTPFSSWNAWLGGAAFVWLVSFAYVERLARAPMIRLSLLGTAPVAAGLTSIALVSAIVMTTLVVGPFYLSGGLGLDAAGTGLVMSVGPTVAALVGFPAGRMVDRLGSNQAARMGLLLLIAGTAAMTVLPSWLEVSGYVASLVLITSGYGLFQAASNTAVMTGAAKDQRGVLSALLALARNVGLVTGASVMGTLFAIGSGPSGPTAGGGQAGLQLVFIVALAMAIAALVVTARGVRHPGPG